MVFESLNRRKGWTLILLLFVMGSFLAVFPLIQMHETTRANSVSAQERWAQWQQSKESHLVQAATRGELDSSDNFSLPGGEFQITATVEKTADSQFRMSSTSQAHGLPSGFSDDATWYGKTGQNNSDFAGGDGSELNPFQISNAEELDRIRNYLDDEYYFMIVKDIDLSPAQWSDGQGWVPIGTIANPFIGHLEAKWDTVAERYYPVDNLKISRDLAEAGPQGLFGFISSGTISNIMLNNVEVTGGRYNSDCTGALVGQAYKADISGVSVSGLVGAYYNVGGIVGCLKESKISISTSTAEVSGNYFVGGIAGKTEKSDFVECTNQGKINGRVKVGGITGQVVNSECFFSKCVNDGIINSNETFAGGILGQGIGAIKIADCRNNGTVTVSNENCGGLAGSLIGPDATINDSSNSGEIGKTAKYTGGLVGYGENLKIDSSFNTGSLKNTSNQYDRGHTGGIAGYLMESEVAGCYNSGSVTTSRNFAGGIAGEVHKATIQKCSNLGSVFGSDHAGGIAGRTTNGSRSSRCNNEGSVRTVNNYSGGITGVNYGSIIEDSYNHGEIRGSSYVGGLLGLNTRYNSSTPFLIRSFSTGVITAFNLKGGVAGGNSGTISYCYWDKTSSGINSSYGGTSKTTPQMKRKNTYSNWDFDNIWDIVENVSYPFLR